MNKLGYIEDYDKVLPVLELYTCIQSEGSRAGYPTIAIRTTGCTHRCFFRDGGWCDSWYTSIHPEKGKYTFNDIVKMYNDNPHIKEMMLTGGSPSMHGDLVNTLTRFAISRDITVTMETEGSHYLETEEPIDLLSISPKFSNSIPVLGAVTPKGTVVDQKFIDTHNRLRMNIPAIAKSIMYHHNFHLKPVIAKDLSNIPDVLNFLDKLADELNLIGYSPRGYLMDGQGFNKEFIYYELKENTWLMPAGDTREALMESYGPVMNYARDNGFKFTPRPHIIAFDTLREV